MFGRGHCSEEGHPFSHHNHSHFFDKAAAFKEWGSKRHRHWKQNRESFSQSDFYFLLLYLLSEKPSYGFELIRAIEEKTEGNYTPKPESVYPTLTGLEDLGYAKVTTEENGKKIYSITAEGKVYLDENKDAVEKVLSIMKDLKEQISSSTMSEVYQAVKNIGYIVFDNFRQKGWTNQQLKKLVTILDKTAEEIKGL
jgi:DNA-binding PadR family transcriptional regulator